MAYKDYTDIIKAAAKKKNEGGGSNSSSSGSDFYDATDLVKKIQLRKTIGLDTFESDLASVGTTISNIYNGWQTQTTMAKTKTTVKAMKDRVDAYNTYLKKYGDGKQNLDDIAKGYQTVLDDWGTLSNAYGQYESGEAFAAAKKKAELDKKFSKTDDEGKRIGLTYDEVQAELKKYKEGSDEYEYLKEYTGYSNLKDFDKAVEDAKFSYTDASGRVVKPGDKFKVYGDPEKEEKIATDQLNGKRDEIIFDMMDKDTSSALYVDEKVWNQEKKEPTPEDLYLEELERIRNQYKLEYGVNDYYEDYKSAADFAEKSQYVSTEGKASFFNDRYSLGYGDVTYEYINDVNGARSKISNEASKYSHDTVGDKTIFEEERGYDKLNPDEVQMYNYLYATEGKDKAQEYLDGMENTLTRRSYNATAKMWEDFIDEKGPAGEIISSVISVPANIFGAGQSALGNIADVVSGKGYDPYASHNTLSNFSSDVRQYTGENIAEATEGMEAPIVGNVPSFLYQTGMSIADTVVGGNFTGEAYTVLMGTNAFQQKARELTEAGEDSDTVFGVALASGVAETLFEKVSIENWLSIDNVDSIRKLATNTLKQVGIEASEEFLTEFANIVADTGMRGESSELARKRQELIEKGYTEEEAGKEIQKYVVEQIAAAAIGGGLSGGALGGSASTVNYHSLSSTGKAINANDRAGEMLNVASLSPEESETLKLYNEYVKNGTNKLSNAQLGNLFAHSMEEADEKTYADLEKVMTPKTDEEKAIEARTESLTKGEQTQLDGENISIKGVKMEDDELVVVTDKGEVAADEITFSENHAELVAYAEGMSEEKAAAFCENYDGESDVKSYAESFELAYAYGETGFGNESVLKNKGVLSGKQASSIYTAAMLNKSDAQQKARDAVNQKHSGNMAVEGNFNDSIIDYDSKSTDGSKVNWNSLTPTQRDAITFAKGFSKATGVNITFVKSNVVDGKYKGKNGSYNAETNTIEIDVYAGRIDADALNDSIIPTLSHEVTHWMKDKSPAMYSQMREVIMNTLASDRLTSEERVAKEMARMTRNHPDMKVTEEMAIDEIVARGCEDMLSNSEKARELLDSLSESEKKTFVGKVKEIFNNLKEWVNELLSKYKSNSQEAKILRQYGDKLDELSKMWDQTLADAIKTNQNLIAEGVVGENLVSENAVQLSVRTYENEGRELLHNWLNNSDLDAKTKTEIMEQMDYVYDVATKYADENGLIDFGSWSETDIVRGSDGSPVLTVVVPNGDYPLNIDFSQVCKKRKTLDKVLNALVRSGDLDLRSLAQSDINNINRIIKEHGFEIACALCFVDAKRYRVNAWADSFADTYNKLVKSLVKGTDLAVDEFNYTGRPVKETTGKLLKNADDSELNFDYINEVLAKNSSGKAIYRYAMAIKNNKALRSTLNSSEIISSAGLDALKVENRMLYDLVNSHQGSAKPKLSHSEVPYAYEILLQKKFNAADAYKVGGVRMQSFSDYMANMFFDYVQMIGDLSAKQLPAHAYTKEYYFAKLFGLTGIKINLSIVPKGADITAEQKARFDKMTKAKKEKDPEFKALKKHAGLDANGNYILEDETFPLEKALELQNEEGYDANCGIIWVGASDAHIKKMLDDPNVPYIIPYHKSSLNPVIARMRNIDFYNDYTKSQNTRYDTKAKKKVPLSVWNFDFYGDLATTKDPRQTAANYVQECRDRGYLPKFDAFADHPNYYKLLIDFRVYDKNGNYAPQGPVQMKFPENFNELVGESLAEAQETSNKLDADMKSLLSDIRKELKIGKEQYSDRDSDGNVLTKEQAEFFKDSKARDDDGSLLVGYHGTSTAGFNEFDFNRMTGSSGFNVMKKRTVGFFTTSKRDADSYGGNDYKGGGKLYDPNENAKTHSHKAEGHKIGEHLRFDNKEEAETFAKAYPMAKYYAPLWEVQQNGVKLVTKEYAEEKGIDTDEKWWEDEAAEELLEDCEKIFKAYMRYESKHLVTATIGELLDNYKDYSLSDFFRAVNAYDSNNSFWDALYEGYSYEDLVDTLRSINEEHMEESGEGITDITFGARPKTGSEYETTDDISRRTYACYFNIKNPFVKDYKGTYAEHTSFYSDLDEALESGKYDGVIAKNLKVGRYKDNGTVVCPFNPNQIKLMTNTSPTDSADIRYSDRDYMNAVNSGDMETAQRMVDEAAKANGYDEVVFHGTNSDKINVFVGSPNRMETNGPNLIKGYFSDQEAYSEDYGDNTFKYYINAENFLEIRGAFDTEEMTEYLARHGVTGVEYNDFISDDEEVASWLDEYGDGVIDPWMFFNENGGNITERIRAAGYKGVYWEEGYFTEEGGYAFMPFESNLIKSADPVVYDNDGKVIPLSERFNAENEDVRYSDREDTSVYDLMGENERLQKDNARLKEDIGRLKERLALEKKVTGGKVFNAKSLRSVAKYLLKQANSDYAEADLVKGLNDVYSYIVSAENVDWNDLMAMATDVARDVVAKQKPAKVTNDYYKSLLGDIRGKKISLSEEQIQEAKHLYGEKYRNAFMGKVILAKNGISLDSQWQEWSTMYPDVFDSDMNPGDQVTALLDIYDSVRESSEVYEKYNEEDMARWLATEIYNQYWNVSTVRTTADKYDKQIKKLNFEHRQAMKAIRDEYKQRLEAQKTADAVHYGKVINRLREKRNTEVREARKLGRKRMNDYRDRVQRDAVIKRITKKAMTLNKWLVTNSKKEHVPEALKPIVANFLSSIDFASKRSIDTGGMNPTKKDLYFEKALSKVHRMMESTNRAAEGDDSMAYYGTIFPQSVVDEVGEMLKRVEDVVPNGDNYTLNLMSTEDLETLDVLVNVLKNSVTQMNKFFVVKHAEGVSNLSQEMIAYADKLGTEKVFKGMKGSVQKLLRWRNAVPYYAFKRFGKSGMQMFEAFQDGWDKFSFNAKDIIDYSEEAYTDKEVKKWKDEIHTISLGNGKKVTMTTPQIMSLYCLQKREQARRHIFEGLGIRPTDIEHKKDVIRQVKGTGRLTEKDVATITDKLSNRQKEVSDTLQKFMQTTCADWGNEVTMLLYGYRAFGEENYFPIKIEGNNLVNEAKDQENSIFRLLNMSFTKAVNENARNTVVVSDIFDVFAQHTSDMAKYNAFALPVFDAFKWYNYSEKLDGESVSVKGSIEDAFGKDGKNYVHTFLQDINGAQNVGRDTLGNRFFTNAKIASVAANMRVVLLQPTSYVRALTTIDFRYLMKALLHKPKISKAEEHCGIALWKSLGYYDTNIQRGLTEQITHAQSTKDKVVEFAMKGAEAADKLTWGYLWNACELEVRAKRKDLKVGNDEFYKTVANRLREVIYRTQVVDSTMTRSEMMRGKDGYDKLLTAFASEPTLSFNMLQDAFITWKLTERETGSKKEAFKKHGGMMARTIITYTLTAAVSSLVEAGFDAYRDDEEMEPEEFMQVYLGNFYANMDLIGKIPYAKEAVSIIQGFNSSRQDTQWMQSIGNMLSSLVKNMNGKGNSYTTVKHAIKALSYASGVPGYNFLRDFTAGLNKLGLLTADELEDIFDATLGEFLNSIGE